MGSETVAGWLLSLGKKTLKILGFHDYELMSSQWRVRKMLLSE